MAVRSAPGIEMSRSVAVDRCDDQARCKQRREVVVGQVIAVQSVPTIRTVEPPLQQLRVSVQPISSQGKSDWDALSVWLTADTTTGHVVPLRGQARFTLWTLTAEYVRSFDETGWLAPGHVVRAASWSRFLEPAAGDSGPLSLPLTRGNGEHDLRVWDFGQLQVEVAVPGVREFSVLSEPFPLRQTGPIRERSLVETGSTFLATEATARSRQPLGRYPRTLSPLRPDRRLFTVQP